MPSLVLSLAVALSSSAHLAGAKVPIDAVVLSVDVAHRSAKIHYAALETAPEGVRVVRVGDKSALLTMHPGERITAVADTSHTPWVISHVELNRLAR